jgi:hypothetical protein
MSARRYLYLMGDGLQATVIDSQVVTILKRFAERGVVFELVAYQPRPPAGERARSDRRLQEVAAELGGKVQVWNVPAPGALVFPLRTAGEAVSAGARVASPGYGKFAARAAAVWARDRVLEARLLRHLAPALLRGQAVVVHARGGAMGLATRLKRWSRRLRVVADFRGDRPAEYRYKMGGLDSPLARREHARLLAQDRAVLRSADAVQCVSAALRDRLAADHGPRAGVRVVPCVADERRFRFDPAAREEVRAARGWRDRRVLVYCGSMLAWQQPEAVVAFYAGLRTRRPALHLLLLTPDVVAARGLLEAHALDESAVTIHAARHGEVPAFLCAADVALLLREPHPLNAAASPTKFAEYVLTGLPVLVSRGIGDLDGHVSQLELGALVENHRDGAELESKVAPLLSEAAPVRSARAARAASVFALGPYVDDWVHLYEAI